MAWDKSGGGTRSRTSGPNMTPSQVVEQRPAEQIACLPRLPPLLHEGGAAHRKQRLLEQRLGMELFVEAVGEGDPDVEVAPGKVDLLVVGLELDGDVRVRRPEPHESRHEPLLRHRLDRHQPQQRIASIATLGHVAQLCERALYVGEIEPSEPVEPHRLRAALKQPSAQMSLESLDVVRDCTGGVQPRVSVAVRQSCQAVPLASEEASVHERWKIRHVTVPRNPGRTPLPVGAHAFMLILNVENHRCPVQLAGENCGSVRCESVYARKAGIPDQEVKKLGMKTQKN